MTSSELMIYTDGGARGNPGPAGIGVVITKPKGETLAEHKAFIGRATNNQAEYRALIKGLELAKDYGARKIVSVMDSELVVKQMKGEYRVRNKGLQPLYQKARALEQGFDSVTYRHVKRENDKIQIADRLVNEALDEKE
ncbi:14.7 kDa ribonuclease H-like protein [archaeon BMS3Abin16]|nr:14.7 kDa ribonuclease H-like protein [archaeon BMS3Abin16]HDY74355.1 ribonuclease HI family protein [Euryarchaeota archaeon]